MLPASIILGLFIFLLGILVRRFPLLSEGYRIFGKERAQNVDLAGMNRFTGTFLVITGIAVVLISLAVDLLKLNAYNGLIIGYFLLAALLLLILLVQKFDHNQRKHPRLNLLALIVAALLLSSFLHLAARDTTFTFTKTEFTIEGTYEKVIPYNEIETLVLTDSIPAITDKVFGFANGRVLKGWFTLETYGETLLYLPLNEPPYIVVTEKSGKHTILNTLKADKTRKVFNLLSEKVRVQ